MIDRARKKSGHTPDPAHPNTPGAREEAKAPETANREDEPSTEVGDELNQTGRKLSGIPSHRSSGAQQEPKAADRVTNKRSKKYRD